jgi:hypothetical protein
VFPDRDDGPAEFFISPPKSALISGHQWLKKSNPISAIIRAIRGENCGLRPGPFASAPNRVIIFPAMTLLQYCELMFYVVETFALPFAIVVFILEQRKERQNEEEEIFQRLSDEYREFLKLVLDNADLHLLRRDSAPQNLAEEQKERRLAIFGILISLFERAYLLVYEEEMDKQTRRMWQSWEDYMREWVRRSEFRDALPQLLEGEDEEFTLHITKLAEAERK